LALRSGFRVVAVAGENGDADTGIEGDFAASVMKGRFRALRICSAKAATASAPALATVKWRIRRWKAGDTAFSPPMPLRRLASPEDAVAGAVSEAVVDQLEVIGSMACRAGSASTGLRHGMPFAAATLAVGQAGHDRAAPGIRWACFPARSDVVENADVVGGAAAVVADRSEEEFDPPAAVGRCRCRFTRPSRPSAMALRICRNSPRRRTRAGSPAPASRSGKACARGSVNVKVCIPGHWWR
jgi:hypothetical protein